MKNENNLASQIRRGDPKALQFMLSQLLQAEMITVQVKLIEDNILKITLNASHDIQEETICNSIKAKIKSSGVQNLKLFHIHAINLDSNQEIWRSEFQIDNSTSTQISQGKTSDTISSSKKGKFVCLPSLYPNLLEELPDFYASEDTYVSLSRHSLLNFINELNNNIVKHPYFTPFYISRAVLFTRAGDWIQAKADCERVLELEEFNPQALFLMGVLWLISGPLPGFYLRKIVDNYSYIQSLYMCEATNISDTFLAKLSPLNSTERLRNLIKIDVSDVFLGKVYILLYILYFKTAAGYARSSSAEAFAENSEFWLIFEDPTLQDYVYNRLSNPFKFPTDEGILGDDGQYHITQAFSFNALLNDLFRKENLYVIASLLISNGSNEDKISYKGRTLFKINKNAYSVDPAYGIIDIYKICDLLKKDIIIPSLRSAMKNSPLDMEFAVLVNGLEGDRRRNLEQIRQGKVDVPIHVREYLVRSEQKKNHNQRKSRKQNLYILCLVIFGLIVFVLFGEIILMLFGFLSTILLIKVFSDVSEVLNDKKK